MLGVPLPAYGQVQIEESDFTQVTPTEFRADLVVTLLQEGIPVLGIVVEVQRQMDPRKPYTWLVYVASERARIEKPVALLVITDDAEVARWARKPIEFGPRSVLSAIVLGPGEVPWIRTEEAASRQPGVGRPVSLGARQRTERARGGAGGPQGPPSTRRRTPRHLL